VEREQTLPKRTADSLRNFWKTVERKGLENYMRNALDSNTWFCHAFCKIPKVKLMFICREDEANGELEREMIRLAESAIQRKTHRQQQLEKSKSGNRGFQKNEDAFARGSKRGASKKPNQVVEDDKVDLKLSEGQPKCSSSLQTCFNLLDHQRCEEQNRLDGVIKEDVEMKD